MGATQTQARGLRQSRADEVEQLETSTGKKVKNTSSIWDNFDIFKISNAGFKLEFVDPEIL